MILCVVVFVVGSRASRVSSRVHNSDSFLSVPTTRLYPCSGRLRGDPPRVGVSRCKIRRFTDLIVTRPGPFLKGTRWSGACHLPFVRPGPSGNEIHRRVPWFPACPENDRVRCCFFEQLVTREDRACKSTRPSTIRTSGFLVDRNTNLEYRETPREEIFTPWKRKSALV